MLRIKQFIISLSVLSVLFNQLAPAYADVIVDTAAPSNHQASMDTAPNGVPVVNITTPDGNGLSHNKFKTFDVDHNGVVLNNSAVVGQSQLGGHVFGNPNLTLGNEAKTILGEVTSGNSSSIMGMIEVLGPSANFILSNNNGITCNGCGFINIPRATFTTGNPVFNDGKLYGFSVDKGRISIEGDGVNAEDSSYFDIIARAADINAAVHGQEISVIAGRNDVAFGNGTITPKADNGTSKPGFAIDSQALGGMYGNRISLIGTESGVGVRAPTNMVSDTGDIVINADGTVTTGKIISAANVNIASQENVVIDEKLYAAQDASVTAQQDVVINEGQQLSSARSIDVNARNLTLEQESSITAGLDESGNSNGAGSLATDLSESLEVKSDSLLYASKEIVAEARDIVVSGFVDADQDVNLHTSRDIINNNVISADSGTVHLSADGEITNNKIISSDNGAVALTAQGDILNNTDASISSWEELELESDSRIDNAGKILAQSSISASAKAGFSNTGTVSALGDANLKSEQTITNSNTLVSGADILIKSDKLLNNQGFIGSKQNIVLEGVGASGTKATLIRNTGGKIETIQGDITFRADNVENTSTATITSSRETRRYNFWKGEQATTLLDRGYGFFSNYTSYGGYDQFWDSGSVGYVLVPNPDYLPAGVTSWTDLTGDGWKSYVPSSTSAPFSLENWTLYIPDEAQAPPSGGQMILYIDTDSLQGEHNPASIVSGHDIVFDVTNTLTNNISSISAANDLDISGTNLVNQGLDIKERMSMGTSYNNTEGIRVAGWARTGMLFRTGTGSTLFSTKIIDSIPSTISAGGNITGNLAGSVSNSDDLPQGAGSDTQNSLNGNFPFSHSSTTIVNVERPASLLPGELAESRENLLSPDRLGFFLRAPESSPYLYETNPVFTDPGLFYGSEYFLSRLGIDDSEALPKRLGDSFYDTRLIRDIALEQAGTRWLTDGALSDADMMKRLIDNAAIEAGNLELTPGVSLTGEQIASLQNDIVWYVTEIIDGEEVLVPRLYLSNTSNIALSERGGKIQAKNIDLAAVNIVNDGSIVAADELNLGALGTLANISGVIRGGDVDLQGGNIVNLTETTRTGNGIDAIGTIVGERSSISAKNNLDLTAMGNISVLGADVTSDGSASIVAGGDVVVSSAEAQHRHHFTYSKGSIKTDRTINIGSSISAGEDLSIVSGNDTTIAGSSVSAGQDADIAAGGNLTVTTTEDIYQYESKRSSKSFFSSSKTEETGFELTNNIAEVSAGGNLTLTSQEGDLTLRAAKLDSGGETRVVADEGNIALLSANDIDQKSVTHEGSSIVWFSTEDRGHHHETVVMTEITADGGLVINAGNGVVVEYRDTGNLEDSVTALAATPGLEWMGEMMERDDATWHAVQEVHKNWDYKAQGLSGAGAAIIAIAVAIVTMGTGAAAAIAAAAQSAAAGAGAGAAVAAGVGAAASAGFTALAARATISLINNQGDLGAVLKELGSSDSLRSLATAMVTAGVAVGMAGELGIDLRVSAEIGDQIAYQTIRTLSDTVAQTAINGGELADNLKFNIVGAIANVASAQLAKTIGDFAVSESIDEGDIRKVVLHAVAGCGIGQLSSQNCAAGAIGAGLQEILGDKLGSTTDETGMQAELTGLVAGLAVALSGGDADAVNTAAFTARQAATYNRQLHTDEIVTIEQKAKELAGQEGMTEAEWLEVLGIEALSRVDADKQAGLPPSGNEAIAEVVAQAFNEMIAEHGASFVDSLGNQLNFLQKDDHFNNSALFAREITQNRDFYDTVLADYTPTGAEALKGVVRPSTLALADALQYSKYREIGGGGFWDSQTPREQEVARILELTATTQQAAQVYSEIRDNLSSVETQLGNPALSETQRVELTAQKTQLQQLQWGLESTATSIASGINRIALSGANEGRAKFIVEGAQALTQFVNDAFMAPLGDSAAQLRNQERVEGFVDLMAHIDELPDTIVSGLQEKFQQANALYAEGNVREGSRVFGEAQAELVGYASGVGSAAGTLSAKTLQAVAKLAQSPDLAILLKSATPNTKGLWSKSNATSIIDDASGEAFEIKSTLDDFIITTNIDGEIYVFGKSPVDGTSSSTLDTKWDEQQFYEQIQASKRFSESSKSPYLKTKWQKVTNAMFKIMEVIDTLDG
ncbi:DUF637 domain-containing protein [Thalassospira xiamenensis]|uniref:two-partner secretion domain-containing protein n=3 Tax=Thalassospira xiamenensis TaxID=220697 RepID=UPI000AB9FD6B|nr:DUF637 domain-containing protein [Thalassospira xiamenensis]